MPRERKPFLKIHPDFLLGRSKAGQRFVSMALEEQAIYIKWLGRCIEVRQIFWECSDESLRIISQNIGISLRKFKRTLAKVLAKHLAIITPDNRVYLKGIQEIHKGFVFNDGDRNGTEREPKRGADSALYGARGIEVKILPPPTPSTESGSPPPGATGGGGTDFFDFWENCGRAFPAIAARGVARETVEKMLAGKNGASAQWLAALAEACADAGVRKPLAVLEKRIAAGAVGKHSLRLAEAVLRPPRGQQECACGGELKEFYCQGSGDSGRRCGQCGASYPREIFR